SEPASAAAFLEPRLKTLADPFLLPNMAAAVERLWIARTRAEPLVIFGDYDVDGVTSTALLLESLRALGWKAEAYLPSRMDEGYGLTQEGAENCLQKFPRTTLLLAVDCGSTAVESIAWLRTRGVEVLVLDHHQVSNPAPAAVALVNPQLSPDGAFVELCSAGLAFKLAHAVVKRGREENLPRFADFDLRSLLDLVALGTVADLVPLTGENRILVPAGLKRLSKTGRPGLIALKKVAEVNGEVNAYAVGFQLGPRLNAAGRMENAEAALRLILAGDAAEAEPLAIELDARNRERQEVERGIAEQAIGAVRARFDPARDFVIVEGQLLWHIGVVGIVASRVLREFYRPTLILGGDNAAFRGSGRSVEGFDLAAALRECDDLLIRHGGHAMAAGVTVHPDKVDALRDRLNTIARRTLRPDQLQPTLRLDAETGLADITLDTVAELARLEPFGQGNPAVQLVVRGLRCSRPPLRMGKEKQHAKLFVTDGTASAEAVFWGVGKAALPDGNFDLAAVPQVNEFNGRRSVQLKVLDWRAAAT
ncbi:MAG: single-stranded-DNA-specific exonuclease RecJ, partial [Pedosphaera sp.]|nr:single-stranded-DNA-specific exonuclease RecJ [Pedosphaera sp.]